MNIGEVYTLNDNLWWFYIERSDPSLYIRIRNHVWHLHEGKITKGSYSLTPQQTSKYLFQWVIG